MVFFLKESVGIDPIHNSVVNLSRKITSQGQKGGWPCVGFRGEMRKADNERWQQPTHPCNHTRGSGSVAEPAMSTKLLILGITPDFTESARRSQGLAVWASARNSGLVWGQRWCLCVELPCGGSILLLGNAMVCQGDRPLSPRGTSQVTQGCKTAVWPKAS